MTTISKIGEKLKDPAYRSAYVASQIDIGIPFQLRALLKSRGKTQEWLAEKTGMLQPRISGLMTPGKTRPNIETLRRLADAFDCGLAVRFVPFSELANWSESFDPEEFSVPDFDGDHGFAEQQAEAISAEDNASHTSSNGVFATSGALIPEVKTLDNLISIDAKRRYKMITDTTEGLTKMPPRSETIELPERNTQNG